VKMKMAEAASSCGHEPPNIDTTAVRSAWLGRQQEKS